MSKEPNIEEFYKTLFRIIEKRENIKIKYTITKKEDSTKTKGAEANGYDVHQRSKRM